MTTLFNSCKIHYGLGAFFAILIPFFYTSTLAQVTIGGMINSYAAVTSFDPCNNRLTVDRTSGFQPGNVVLLIQMQGASINQVGNITNYNNAGSYERATIAEIQGNTITLTKDMIKSYDLAGKVQMVSVPQFGNVEVNSRLTAAPWDGAIGGILAFEASGNVILNADISVDGTGFRGGGITTNTASGCDLERNVNGFTYNSSDWRSAFKGEGITAIEAGRELGRGSQANGGGGGNDHNSGGGGGGNYGQGGLGGRNNEPGLFRCRGFNPGLGGNSVNNSNERIFFGGGGGGGHSNNNFGTPGGNGGGIIYISANALSGIGRNITANGITALNGKGDGVGGGGGGGTIMLNVNQVNTQALLIAARGGNGASVDNLLDNRCFGPGGGGGGGTIFISPAFDPTEINPDISGGQAGITFNTRNACNGSTNGAQSGGDGIVIRNVVIPTGLLDPGSGCITPTPVDYLYFKAQAQANHVYLEWATAREKNNDYFSVERSEDGEDFYEVGQIPGKGTFNSVSTYTFQDNNPLYGVAYYRIRQVDYDNKFAYTGIETIEYNTGEIVMSIFPNPVQYQQNLNVKIHSPIGGEAMLRIYTLLGDEKYNRQYSVTKGVQTIELSMDNFTAGWYIVHLQVGNNYKIQKMKVVR